MNYRELKNKLEQLTEAQLDMSVKVSMIDEPLMMVQSLLVLPEDMFNPSGEGCEPVSLYCRSCEDETDECAHDDPVVFKKDEVFLVADFF